jgi:hypothetical protein
METYLGRQNKIIDKQLIKETAAKKLMEVI